MGKLGPHIKLTDPGAIHGSLTQVLEDRGDGTFREGKYRYRWVSNVDLRCTWYRWLGEYPMW